MQFAKDKKKSRLLLLLISVHPLHYWAMCVVADYKMANNNVSAAFGSVGIVASFADNRKTFRKSWLCFSWDLPKESEHKNEAIQLALKEIMIRLKRKIFRFGY
jgi:protease-4